MKERWIGVGLGVAAVLALGSAWTDSAQAFSVTSQVTVENFLRDPQTSARIPYTGTVPIVQGPVTVSVDSSGPELLQFGGIWDIDLGDNFILFTLNSAFENVRSGDDVYSFQSADLDQMGNFPAIEILSFTAFSSNNRPFARFIGSNKLEVIFPRGFAPEGLLAPEDVSKPTFTTNLPVEPYTVPTPALLPGLVGMGLAVWRRRNSDRTD